MNAGVKLFLNYADIACLVSFRWGGREEGRVGGREGFCVVRFHSNILRRNHDVVPHCQ